LQGIPNHTTYGHSVRVPHGNFSQVRMTESFPTVTVSEIRPSSEMCVWCAFSKSFRT